MNKKLFVIVVLAAVAVGAVGYMLLKPGPQPQEGEPTNFPFGNRTGMPGMGNRTNMYSGLLAVVNTSTDYSEIQEYIANTTESMNTSFNNTRMPWGNFTDPFTDLFSELEEDIQGYIDNETPLQDVKEQMILKIEEFLESMTHPEPPEGGTPPT